MSAFVFHADGRIEELPGSPTLEEAQKIVGGYVEVVYVRCEGRPQIIVDEEGKLKGYPVNVLATRLYANSDDVIVGDAIILTDREKWT